jgi:hypothetical protein
LIIATVVTASGGVSYAQGPLYNGRNHTGEISSPGEVDSWTFTAAQNDAIIIGIGEVLSGVDPGFWPRIRLLDPSGTPYHSASGPLAAQIAVTAPANGTYTIVVSSADSEVHRETRRAVSVSSFSVFVSLRRKPCRRLAACVRDFAAGVRMPPSAPAVNLAGS